MIDQTDVDRAHEQRVKAAVSLVEPVVRFWADRYPEADEAELRDAVVQGVRRAAREHDRERHERFLALAWSRAFAAAREVATRGRRSGAVREAGERAIGLAAGIRDETSPVTGDDAEFLEHGKRASREITAGFSHSMLTAEVEQDGEEGLVRFEERARTILAVRGALDALPADQRRLVALRLEEGVTAKQAATILGISKATVDRRMAKIEGRLRALLEARGVTQASVPGARTRRRT